MRGTVVLDNVRDVTVSRDPDGDTVTVDGHDGDSVIVMEMTTEVAEVLRQALLEPMSLVPGVELYANQVITAVGVSTEARDCFTCEGGIGVTERAITASPKDDPETRLHFTMSCAAQ